MEFTRKASLKTVRKAEKAVLNAKREAHAKDLEVKAAIDREEAAKSEMEAAKSEMKAARKARKAREREAAAAHEKEEELGKAVLEVKKARKARKRKARKAKAAAEMAAAETAAAEKAAAEKAEIVMTGDRTRDIVLQKLHDIFLPLSDKHKAALLAQECEKAMYFKLYFSGYDGTKRKYWDRFCALRFNLQDSKNPDFRLAVLSGKIHIGSLADMNVQDMASNALKAERAHIRKYGIPEERRRPSAWWANPDKTAKAPGSTHDYSFQAPDLRNVFRNGGHVPHYG